MNEGAERWARIEDLFLEALELPLVEREVLLTKRCSGDLELRREVESMLAAHDEPGLAIESRLLGEGTALGEVNALRKLGPYRLLEVIGRGGMGEVFLAERADDQYEKKVAIKLLRPGFHAAEMISRFMRERQILARLEHPNIATLLDGGVDEDGRPYLVMQYVPGEPITSYCERRGLGIEERLRLFVTVCDAVQFSHANLVVHRDLKPSNILVTEDGTPKLLDFGIAKLLDPQASPADATRAGMQMLTPERAAPEQLLGQPVTAAVDVYALGLLLCELLTGKTPYKFSSNNVLAIAAMVTSQPPTPPSALLTDEALLPEGQKRLRRQLAGEPDRIVLMALRREPERRYVSAAQLGEDVDRYLRGEPVLAHADSRTYRARKFLQRNRLGTAVAALLALMVLGFGMVTAFQNYRIVEQRDRANAERDRANAEREHVEAVVRMMTDLLAAADPTEAPGQDLIAVTDLLERGEKTVTALEDQPETRARMLLVLGQIYLERGLYDKGHELLVRAQEAHQGVEGATEATALEIEYRLALALRLQGNREAARTALKEALASHREVYGTEHEKTLQVMNELASALPLKERGPLLQEVLDVRRALLAPQDLAIAATLDRLASYHRVMGDLPLARQLYREALAMVIENLGEKHPHTATVLNNLATALEDPDEKIREMRRVVELRQEILPESVDTALAWNNLGVFYFEAGRREEARQAWESSLELLVATVGADDWRVANTIRNVGLALELEGRDQEALSHFDRALPVMRQAKGDEDLAVGVLRSQRAQILARLGRNTEALREAREAVEIVRRASPEPTEGLTEGLVRLGKILLTTGSVDEAEMVGREALALSQSLFGAEDPRTNDARAVLGRALAALGRSEEALPLLREAQSRLVPWPMANPRDLAMLEKALSDLDQ